ncbi:MAG: tetratricopeptide repeat protein [Anaerolineae bacterium]|nr:tetratricopeptide repeat protein [Anaerolineae bacterium]
MKRPTTHTKHYGWLILLLITIVHASQCTPYTPPSATPDIVTEYLRAAEEHIAAGEYTAAETAYREAIQAAPNDPHPILELARLYLLWQRPQAGLSALDEALRYSASSQENAILRLELLALAGDWSQITAEATERLRAYPDDDTALGLLTEAYLQDYQCVAAATMAQRWHEAVPNNRDASLTWSLLASDPLLLCETDARLRETEFCAQSGDRKDPDMEVAAALIRNGNWPLAACVLTHAVSMGTDGTVTAEMHTWLGEALIRVGRPAEAKEHLVTATTLAPEAPLGWLFLGTYYLSQQETDAAREALLYARTLDPLNPAPCLAMAEATAQAGRYDEVDVWIAAALDNAPTDADIAKTAARFYLERHLIHTEYPFRAIESAIQLAPDDGEAQMLLGEFRLMTGDNAGALIALDTAVRLTSTLGQAHYLRGLALQAAGRDNDAQNAFVRAADLSYRP